MKLASVLKKLAVAAAKTSRPIVRRQRQRRRSLHCRSCSLQTRQPQTWLHDDCCEVCLVVVAHHASVSRLCLVDTDKASRWATKRVSRFYWLSLVIHLTLWCRVAFNALSNSAVAVARHSSDATIQWHRHIWHGRWSIGFQRSWIFPLGSSRL